MTRPPTPTPGQTGPRRPFCSPLSYRRDRVSELRRLPIRENPCLQLLSYKPTPALPTGDRPRTLGYGAVRLADFVMTVCVACDGGAVFLETEARCYDELRHQRELMSWTAQARADVLRLVEQRHRALLACVAGGRN